MIDGQTDRVTIASRGGSRKKYLGGPGPSSFGRQLAAETWFRFFGGRGRRISAENFLPSPQMAKFGGPAGRGGYCLLEVWNYKCCLSVGHCIMVP